MPLYPDKLHLMRSLCRQKAFPKIYVFYRLIFAAFPPLLDPTFNPVLVERIYKIAGIRMPAAPCRACLKPPGRRWRPSAPSGCWWSSYNRGTTLFHAGFRCRPRTAGSRHTRRGPSGFPLAAPSVYIFTSIILISSRFHHSYRGNTGGIQRSAAYGIPRCYNVQVPSLRNLAAVCSAWLMISSL